MLWARLLAYVTGTVNQEFLLRNEYLVAENRILKAHRIVGALANLGHRLSDQTVGNILRRYNLSPAPKRKQSVSWKDFIRSHRDVLVGMDFFTAEVLTLKARVAGPHYWGPAL